MYYYDYYLIKNKADQTTKDARNKAKLIKTKVIQSKPES